MAAAASGQNEVIGLLVKKNANLNIKSDVDEYCEFPCSDPYAFGVT